MKKLVKKILMDKKARSSQRVTKLALGADAGVPWN